jgi:hypothetical protein
MINQHLGCNLAELAGSGILSRFWSRQGNWQRNSTPGLLLVYPS